MEVIICKDKNEASELAARVIKNQIKNHPRTVLGLATGSTPLTLYKKFIDLVEKEKLHLDLIRLILKHCVILLFCWILI